MISIEAYRSCIGNFAFTSQKDLKSIWKKIIIGSYLESNGLKRLLKPAPFIALFFFLTFAFPKSYEVLKPKPMITVPPLTHVYSLKYGKFSEYPKQNICELSLPYLKMNFTLLLSGDIELNPGPATVKKGEFLNGNELLTGQPMSSVQGSFNQSDLKRFGDTAGIQC